MQTNPASGGRNSPTALARRRALGRAQRAAPLLLYAALAVGATWPLARAPSMTLPLGTSQVATVPLFNLWTIWWNADRLRHGFWDYWDAPIFFPTPDAFAFSEPQLTTIAVAPILWLTGSRALAFNVYLWGSLVLNGVFAERLLRRLMAKRTVAVGGGAAMLLLPIVHWQLDVLQLAPLWAILWTWTALLDFSRRSSLVRGALVGAAFAASFWTCAHQGLLMTVLLAGAAWILPRRWCRPATGLGILAAVALAVALVFPMVNRLQRVIARHQFARTSELMTELSAEPVDYTNVPGRQVLRFDGFGERSFWRLSPGWTKLLLATAGAAFGLCRRRWRRWALFLLITALLAFLLSLGPNLRLGSWQPWFTLTKFCSGLAQVRNVFRFAFFFQMAVVLLAAQALQMLVVFSRRSRAQRWKRSLTIMLASLLGMAALVETFPDAPNVALIPDVRANAGWIDFVRRETPPGKALACIPFAAANNVESYEVTTRWMYFGTFHGVPLVDGYSGFFPREHFEIRDAVNRSLLSAETLQRLSELGAELLVVSRPDVALEIPASGTYGDMLLVRVFRDPVGVDVFRLEPKSPGSPK